MTDLCHAPRLCSVTFGPNPNQYSFTTGTFSRIGQNVSFTSDRVNQTTYALSAS